MRKFTDFISRFIPTDFSYIKFLTGSRAKSGFWYKNGSFKPMAATSPSAPLYLEDFESVKYVAHGKFAMVILVKCTFKNGEEAMASVNYSMLESLAGFIIV